MGFAKCLGFVLLFLLCSVWGLCAHAAGGGPGVVQEDMTARLQSWRYFDDRDGLVDGRIRDVCRTEDGSMWFAGQNGVSRYDGIQWTTYSSEAVGIAGANTILQTRDGSIWVGANDGVARFQNGAWSTHKQIDGLDQPTVTTLCESANGTLWAGFGRFEWQREVRVQGLARWDGIRWQRVPQENGWRNQYVNHVYEGPGGILWVATDGGVCRFDGTQWTSFPVETGLPHAVVQTTLEEPDGTVWFGTVTGLTRFQKGEWTTYLLEGEDVEHSIDSMHRTSDGTIWAWRIPTLSRFDGTIWAYSGSTLSRFDGTRLTVCRIPVRGPSSRVYAKMYGDEDVLWLAGWPGVVRLDYGGREWSSYGDVGSVVEAPDGSLWFQRDGGVVTFDGTTWRNMKDVTWPVLPVEDGAVWCGGAEGIQILDAGTWKPHPGILDSLEAITRARDGRVIAMGKHDGRSRVAIFNGEAWKVYGERDWGEGVHLARKVVEMPDGDLWFLPELEGTQVGYGLVRFDGTQWTRDTTSSILGGRKELDESLLNRVYDLAVDASGKVWVGTGGGLWWFNGQEWQVFLTPDGDPGLSGPGIQRVGLAGMKITRVMVAQDSSVFFACGATRGGGVTRYKDGIWTTYTTLDGLVSNDVWEITETQDGVLWFGTSAGVSRYDGRNWTNFTHEDLLLNNDVRQIFQDERGAIWFGGKTHQEASWVTRYRADTLPPQTRLTFTPGKELPSGNLILEWTGRDVWNDTPVDDLLYSWQMDDGPWSDLSAEVKGVFAGLESGSHVFRVRARDKDSNEDPVVAQFQFYVIPPVWKQPWFIGLMAVLAGIIGFQASRLVVVNRKLR
ncbi:MAG: hypothetical protein O2954_14975, partial [bacterium]|nr:hypothetical protein [bacterium]